MFDTKIKLVKQKTQKFMISNVLLAQTQVKLKNSNFFQSSSKTVNDNMFDTKIKLLK